MAALDTSRYNCLLTFEHCSECKQLISRDERYRDKLNSHPLIVANAPIELTQEQKAEISNLFCRFLRGRIDKDEFQESVDSFIKRGFEFLVLNHCRVPFGVVLAGRLAHANDTPGRAPPLEEMHEKLLAGCDSSFHLYSGSRRT